jgi:hypothetical protein
VAHDEGTGVGVRSVVVLLGAGASYAVGETIGHVLPGRPPLTKDLYDELARFSPDQWGPTSPMASHAAAFRSDFEATFSRVTDLFESTLASLEKLATLGRFFARFSLGSGRRDLYSMLVDGLHSAGMLPRTVFGSLNYDVLLEHALERAGFASNWLLDEAKSRLQARDMPRRDPAAVVVAKLHGSSNFVPDIDGDIEFQRLRRMADSPGMHVEVTIRALSPSKLGHSAPLERVANTSDYFPIMSQVHRDKQHLLSLAHITQIRGLWAEEVNNAALVVVIGVRPLQHDRHVWEPLQKTKAPRLYIGGSSDFVEWSKCDRPAWRHVDEQWTEVDRILEAVRLEAG